MKLKFDSHQDFQVQAFLPVAHMFEGQPLNTTDHEFSLQDVDSSPALTEKCAGGTGRAVGKTRVIRDEI